MSRLSHAIALDGRVNGLLVVGLLCAVGAVRFDTAIHHSCPLDVACVCGSSINNLSYATLEECQHSTVNCTSCQPANQTLTDGLHCKPLTSNASSTARRRQQRCETGSRPGTRFR